MKIDFTNIAQSRVFRNVLIGSASVIILLLTFKAGMVAGFRKSSYSFNWGQNYHRNFGGPREGWLDDLRGRDFIDGNGITGQILKIDDSTLVLKGRDGAERVIVVTDDTAIRRFKDSVSISDLHVDELIVVIGEPNDQGRIVAKLIRLMPPAPNTLPAASQDQIPGTTPALDQIPGSQY